MSTIEKEESRLEGKIKELEKEEKKNKKKSKEENSDVKETGEKTRKSNTMISDATIRVPVINNKPVVDQNIDREKLKEEIKKELKAEMEKELKEKNKVQEDEIDGEEYEIDDETEDEVEEKEEKKPKREKKKKKRKVLRVLITLFFIGLFSGLFLLYGPWSGFRDWYITSAMTTMNHQWLATMLYPKSVIDDVMEKNKVNEIDDVTDSSQITAPEEVEENKEPQYANEYEKAVLEKDPEHEDYKLIDITGKTYNGYLAVIYDASKIHTMVTPHLNVRGDYVANMAKAQGAVLAINGGGFDDPNYSSNGGTPTGITFARGKVITARNNSGSVGGLIGFDNNNVLNVGKISVDKAKSMGIRDAVTCGPLLIVNGQSSEVLGNGGWGQAARTVIGQRKDGIVLMLVLNGRNYKTGILGADMNDLIEIMENYGAYNAACLDGGTSSVMCVNGEVINDPIDSTGAHKTRFVPTAFGLFLNE